MSAATYMLSSHTSLHLISGFFIPKEAWKKCFVFIYACFSQGKEKMADMRRKALSRNSKSDHLTIVNAFQVQQPASISSLSSLSIKWTDPVWLYHALIGQGWEEAKQRGARYEREYCWDNFLSANTLQVSAADCKSSTLKYLRVAPGVDLDCILKLTSVWADKDMQPVWK